MLYKQIECKVIEYTIAILEIDSSNLNFQQPKNQKKKQIHSYMYRITWKSSSSSQRASHHYVLIFAKNILCSLPNFGRTFFICYKGEHIAYTGLVVVLVVLFSIFCFSVQLEIDLLFYIPVKINRSDCISLVYSLLNVFHVITI